MQSRKPSLLFVSGIVAAAFVTLTPALSSASEVFPAEIQKKAGIPCTPSCTLCHTTNPGMQGTWVGKPFGMYMGTHGATTPGNTAGLDTAFDAYKADPTKMAGVTALQSGIDPDNGNNLCSDRIIYGCALHAAPKAPSRDYTAPLLALGAIVLGGIVRRRKRS